MEILVSILAGAVVAAIIVSLIYRRSGAADRGAVDRAHGSPLGRRGRGIRHRDPMAAAVAEHAQAIEPHDVVAAEQRLQAQASQIAASLQANANSNGNGLHRVPGGTPTTDMHLDDAIDPRTGERVDGYGDPANDPRYGDRRYDGRLAADYVDPTTGEDPG